jgi:hypothetical protein
MRQVKIIAVNDSSLTTADGSVVFPVGNKVFNPGDYAWVNGNVVFGHMPTGGSAVISGVMDIIPCFSYLEGKFSFGTVSNASYKKYDDYEQSFFYDYLFVNNKNIAYFLQTTDSNTQTVDVHNLMTGKTVATLKGVPLNANINEKDDVLFCIWNRDFSTSVALVYGSAPGSITEGDIKIYKDDEIVFDFSTALHDIYNLIKRKVEKAYDGQENSWIWSTSINTMYVAIDENGECKYLGETATWIQEKNDGNGNVTNKTITEYYEIDVTADGSYAVNNLVGALKIPINDGFYYIATNNYPNNDPLSLYQKDGGDEILVHPLSQVNGWEGGSNFGVKCVVPYKNGYLINLQSGFGGFRATVNNTVTFVKDGEEKNIFKPDFCFNTKFEKMSTGKFNVIRSNLKEIWKGSNTDE